MAFSIRQCRPSCFLFAVAIIFFLQLASADVRTIRATGASRAANLNSQVRSSTAAGSPSRATASSSLPSPPGASLAAKLAAQLSLAAAPSLPPPAKSSAAPVVQPGSNLAAKVAAASAKAAIPSPTASSSSQPPFAGTADEPARSWQPSFDPLIYRERVRQTFTHAYDSYMRYAFPTDELDPIGCRGRGPDYADRSNININDVLGNYSLTAIDTLTTLAVMGNASEFWRLADRIGTSVDFDQDSNVQTFEVTIRVLGALLSAHLTASGQLLAIPPRQEVLPSRGPYKGRLLFLARDLGARLLPAFDVTPTGLPLPRINLRHGRPRGGFWRNDTCTAGAGTLTLEFGVLSGLTRDPVYAGVAKRALQRLWAYRSTTTGLLGSSIDINTGRWLDTMSGIGAGLDSFFEYLLKAHILFGQQDFLRLFEAAMTSVGRRTLLQGMPLHVNVDMNNGHVVNNWVDSLSAYFPGLLALYGDLKHAMILIEVYISIWRKHGALPERFNWRLKVPDFAIYPLRPELFESLYHMYRATKNRYYQRVGAELFEDLIKFARARCGFATLHDVATKELEDRMESFFLSETLKYLYLLFDDDNPLHQPTHPEVVFTTEGHPLPVIERFRHWLAVEELVDSLPPKKSKKAASSSPQSSAAKVVRGPKSAAGPSPPKRLTKGRGAADPAQRSCSAQTWRDRFFPPLTSEQLIAIRQSLVGEHRPLLHGP